MATTPPEEYSEHDDDTEREATEMDSYNGVLGGNGESLGSRRGARVHPESNNSYFKPIKCFWKRQVSATVPHEACRDHFGMHKPSFDAANDSKA